MKGVLRHPPEDGTIDPREDPLITGNTGKRVIEIDDGIPIFEISLDRLPSRNTGDTDYLLSHLIHPMDRGAGKGWDREPLPP